MTNGIYKEFDREDDQIYAEFTKEMNSNAIAFNVTNDGKIYVDHEGF